MSSGVNWRRKCGHFSFLGGITPRAVNYYKKFSHTHNFYQNQMIYSLHLPLPLVFIRPRHNYNKHIFFVYFCFSHFFTFLHQLICFLWLKYSTWNSCFFMTLITMYMLHYELAIHELKSQESVSKVPDLIWLSTIKFRFVLI